MSDTSCVDLDALPSGAAAGMATAAEDRAVLVTLLLHSDLLWVTEAAQIAADPTRAFWLIGLLAAGLSGTTTALAAADGQDPVVWWRRFLLDLETSSVRKETP